MEHSNYLRIYHIDAWFDGHRGYNDILNAIVFYLHDPSVDFVKAAEWKLDLATDAYDGVKVETKIPSERTVIGWKQYTVNG